MYYPLVSRLPTAEPPIFAEKRQVYPVGRLKADHRPPPQAGVGAEGRQGRRAGEGPARGRCEQDGREQGGGEEVRSDRRVRSALCSRGWSW